MRSENPTVQLASGRRPGALAAVLSAALLAALPLAPAQAKTDPQPAMQRVTELPIPGNPLKSFDISTVDGNVYALSDRSNQGMDLFNADTGQFLGRAGGFAGLPAKGHDDAGPNGLANVGPHQIWAGDGDSTVKVVDIASRKVVDSISTGGKHRVDELAYDAHDGLVAAANNADNPPFLSFISTHGDPKLLGRLVLKQATDGIEQAVWDPASDLFYVPIPELNGDAAQGGIAVVDPNSRKLLRMIPISKCIPAGLALGPHQHLLIGCSDDAVAAGLPAKSMIMDLPSGKILRTFHQVGGSDEVWFDKAQGMYDLAAVANPGGPVLGLINARTDRWIGNLPTGRHAHSVAADGALGEVFVPIAASPNDPACSAGCIAVFGRKR